MLRVKKILFIMLFQAISLSSFTHAGFDDAVQIYNAGKFNEAKKAFEVLATIGDRPSLFNLGVMHYRGESFEKNSVKGYVLMKIANDGLEDKSFTRITKSIFNSFDDQQKKEAENVFTRLDPVYNISSIRRNIFPKLLNDENCPPEVEPIKSGSPVYPYFERRAGRMGHTQMEFTISPEGYPRDMTTTESTNDAFTKASVAATKKTVFAPTLDGSPIYGHRYAFTYHLVTEDTGERSKIITIKLSRELNELKDSASNGDAVAQYLYASRLNTFRHFRSYLEKVDLQYKTANEWFTKSAENGLPHAQYEIGRNMHKGRGCEIDAINGYKWINAAAIGGYPPAQKALAQSALMTSDVSSEKSLAAIGWLRNSAQSNDFSAKLLLAWELSTSTINELRNGEEALNLLDSDTENYFDEVRIMETKAAAYAELGDFRKAKKFQGKAAKIASTLKWNIPLISERLGLYEHAEPYRGSYY